MTILEASFNPCSGGISSGGKIDKMKEEKPYCFNPCSGGISSGGTVYCADQFLQADVSILVLVEFRLGERGVRN